MTIKTKHLYSDISDNSTTTLKTLSGFDSKTIRTCTHEVFCSEISGCLECQAWDEIKKNHKPIYDKKTKTYTITTNQFTIDFYKNKLKN